MEEEDFGDVQLKVSGLQDRNVATLCLNSQRNNLNILDNGLFESLSQAFARVKELVGNNEIQVLVVCSAKPNVFAAGADLTAMLVVEDPAIAEQLVCQFQGGLKLLEDLPITTIAVINGTCLGGGLEIALACDYRIADHACKTIGLPEVKVGVLPAGGGCVRLPRLIGLLPAINLIVPGRAVSARESLSLGIVHKLFSCTSFNDGPDGSPAWIPELLSCWSAKKLINPLTPKTKYPRQYIGNTWAEQTIMFTFALKQIDSTKMNVPSPYAALHTVFKAWNTSKYEEAFQAESTAFGRLVVRSETKAMLSLFLHGAKTKSKSLTYGLPESDESGTTPEPPQTFAVLILGAGHMGGGIAQGLLHKGVPVTLYDISEAALDDARERILRLFSPQVKKGSLTKAQLEERMSLLTLTTDIQFPIVPAEKRDGCVYICIECVPETLQLKKDMYAKVEAQAVNAGIEFIFATNTSSIPISLIGAESKNPKNVVGMHFFHPEKNITPVVEIAITSSSSPDAIRSVASLADRLGKLPVVVQEAPGFVVNRVMGVMYALSAAVLCLGGASLSRIETTMMEFGFKSGPFETLDRIGLKTALLVGRSIQELSAKRKNDPHKAFISRYVTTLLEKMVDHKLTGRHPVDPSLGFYSWKAGRKGALNSDIKSIAMVVRSELAQQSALASGSPLATSRMKPLSKPQLMDLMSSAMSNEAALIFDEGISTPSQIDLLMVLTGYPAKHGGPLMFSDAIGHANCTQRLTTTSNIAFGSLGSVYPSSPLDISQSLLGSSQYFPTVPHIANQPPFPPRNIPFFFDAVAIFLSILIGLGAQQLIASRL